MIEGHITVENGAALEANGADQPMPWWSFAKTVIAAAALALVAKGRLALDEALPGRPYTLRQLLQNRAGVPNYGGLAAYHEAVTRGEDPWPVEELLERAGADWLRFPPGQGWEYSNIGYLFARQCVERAAGEEFGVALERLVLAPLGIEGVRFARRRADLEGIRGVIEGYHPGWVYHGLLVGPLRAACLLLDRVMSGGLLPTRLLDAMRDAHRLGGKIADRPWQTHGYGLGLMIGTVTGGARALGHTGGGPGSVCAIYHFPGGTRPRTAAAFALGSHEGLVENGAVTQGTRAR